MVKQMTDGKSEEKDQYFRDFYNNDLSELQEQLKLVKREIVYYESLNTIEGSPEEKQKLKAWDKRRVLERMIKNKTLNQVDSYLSSTETNKNRIL